LRDLEAAGVVRGYHADVDAETVGPAFTAIVFVMMRQGTEDGRRLRCRRRRDPEIVRAQRPFGDPDYLLRVVAADLGAYQRLYDEKFAGLPGVKRLTSTLVMKDVVDRGLAL
jgi:DNA-binding Lrp family transcriptional regulator